MNSIDLSLYLVTDNSDDVEKFLKTIEDGIKLENIEPLFNRI